MIAHQLTHCEFVSRFKQIRKQNHPHLGEVILFKDLETKYRVIGKVFHFVRLQELELVLDNIKKMLCLTNPNEDHDIRASFCRFLAYTVSMQKHQKEACFMYQFFSNTLHEQLSLMTVQQKNFKQKDIVIFIENILYNLKQLNIRNIHHQCLTSEIVLVHNLDSIESSFKLLLTPFMKDAVSEIKIKNNQGQGMIRHQTLHNYNLSNQQCKLLYLSKKEFTQEEKTRIDKESLGLLLVRMLRPGFSQIYRMDDKHRLCWNIQAIKSELQNVEYSAGVLNMIDTLLFSHNSNYISFEDFYVRAKQLNKQHYYNESGGKRSMSNSRRSKKSIDSKDYTNKDRHILSAVKVNWDSRTNSIQTPSPNKDQSMDRNILTVEQIEQSVLLDSRGKPYQGIVQKVYSDGAKYVGQLSNGIRQGKGVYYYPQGDVYGGQWKNNNLQGHGIYLFGNGQNYQGEIRQGFKHGRGTYCYTNNNKYTGQWKNDKKSGYGVYQYNHRGDIYQGNFTNGLREGTGKYKWRSGNIYEGEFEKNLKHGQGRGTQANGTLIQTKWTQDRIDDPVQINFHNGDGYIGEFKSNTMTGIGTYKYLDGTLYEGQFKEGKKTGKCEIHYSNGDVYQGQILNGKPQGKGKYIYKSPSMTYEGHWDHGVQNGRGRVIFPNSTVLETDWYKGQPEKKCTLYYSNSEKYTGQVNFNGRNGEGIYQFSNGAKVRAKWMDGQKTY